MDQPELNDLNRRIESLVRLGVVEELHLPSARCRVRHGKLLTTWIDWITPRAGNVRHWSPPSIGEQCLLIAPGGDLAAAKAITGIFSTANPAPSASPNLDLILYPDGAVISYDHGAHHLAVTLPGGGTAEITAPVSLTVHSPDIRLDGEQTTCTGGLLVQGPLVWQSGASGRPGTAGGPAMSIVGDVGVTGSVAATVDVVAAGVSAVGHKHGGIKRGGELSDAPQASA